MRKMRLLIFSACAILISLILGCQGVFTFAPFGFAADDPAKMPRDQLITYSWDVIASGDDAKMTAALDAVKSALSSSPNDAKLNYTAANLCITISKAVRIFTNQTEIVANFPDSFKAFKLTIDPALLKQSGPYYDTAKANGAQLNAVDNVFACIGLLLTTPGPDLTALEGMTPPIPPDTPPAGWASVYNPLAGPYMDAGIGTLGGYGPSNLWWMSILTCFFTPLP